MQEIVKSLAGPIMVPQQDRKVTGTNSRRDDDTQESKQQVVLTEEVLEKMEQKYQELIYKKEENDIAHNQKIADQLAEI